MVTLAFTRKSLGSGTSQTGNGYQSEISKLCQLLTLSKRPISSRGDKARKMANAEGRGRAIWSLPKILSGLERSLRIPSTVTWVELSEVLGVSHAELVKPDEK